MIPNEAPTMTSNIQCLLLSTRINPTAVAHEYPKMVYQKLLLLYCKYSIVAIMKAVAVCPDGDDRVSLPSGRNSLIYNLRAYIIIWVTAVAIKKNRENLLLSISPL